MVNKEAASSEAVKKQTEIVNGSRFWIASTLGFLLVGIASTIVLWLQGGIIGHNWDWSVNFNADGTFELAKAATSAWWSVELGTPNVGVGNTPFWYLEEVFAHMPGLFSHLIVLLVPVFGALAGLTLALRIQESLGLRSRIGAWIGGLVFGFSPLYFNELQGGAITQVFAHSALAMTLASLLRYRSKGSNSALFTAALWTPLVALSLTDFTLMFVVTLAFLSRPRIRAYVAFAASAMLLNLYWILPFIYNARTLLESPGWSTAVPTLAGAVATPWQLFTLSGYFFSFYDNARPIWVWLADFGTVFLMFAAFYAIHKARLTRSMFTFYALFFVGTAAAAVAVGPLGPVMIWAYKEIPLMATLFRSPQHLMIIPTIAGAMVIATGVAAIARDTVGRNVIVGATIIALASRAPFLTGDLSTRYLSQLGPGRSITTYVPSPGYRNALKVIQRGMPSRQRQTRALFVPLAFSPLYKWTPYQSPGQGGDISQLFLRHMAGSITYLPQVVTPDGASVERSLTRGFPGVLTTGLPAALDVSNVVIRYDVLANFEPFRGDAMLAFDTAHTLDSHSAMWRRILSQDFVDVYREHAPPHVFLTPDLRIADGSASDLADVEVPAIAPAVVLTGTSPFKEKGGKPYYEFESRSDAQIDASAGKQIVERFTPTYRFFVKHAGDYSVVLKRSGDSDISSLRFRIDGFDIKKDLIQFTDIDAAEFAGARWIRYATVFLQRGSHLLSWLTPAAGVRAMAIIRRASMPPNADYSYGDAPVIGIRTPRGGESLTKAFNLEKRRHLDVYAIVQQIPNDGRRLPVTMLTPRAGNTDNSLPFISADTTDKPILVEVPPYWFIQRAQPRVGPFTSIVPSTSPLHFIVSIPSGASVDFHADVSAVNRSRVVSITSGARTVRRRLRSELRQPTDALALALGFTRRPVDVSLPVDGGAVNVSFSPAINIWGPGSGLPTGAVDSAWIDLHRAAFRAALPRTLQSEGATSPIFGTSVPSLPVGKARSVVVYLKALGVQPSVDPRANAIIRCGGDLRSYIIPAQYRSGERRVSLRLQLSGLQSIINARNCNMAGVAVQLSAVGSGVIPPYNVLGGAVYSNQQWLLPGAHVELRPVARREGVYRIARSTSRFLQLRFGLGHPRFIMTRGDKVVGKSYAIQHWHWDLKTAAPQGYEVSRAPISVEAERDLNGSEGRAALQIGKRVVLNKKYVIAGGSNPFWYRKGPDLYIVWPAKLPGFGRGTLYVVPSSWFTYHRQYQTVTLDVTPGFRKAAGKLFIHLLTPEPLFPTARFVHVSASVLPVHVVLDHAPLLLRLHADDYGGMMRTDTTKVSLGRGRHKITFSRAGDKACLIIQRPVVDNQLVERLHVVSRSMYEWTVDVPARHAPMAIGLLESYNKAWRLWGVKDARHFVLNGYANGWAIPPGPPERVTIYYLGQTWLRVGALIAGLTLIAIFVLIAIYVNKEGYAS